MHICHMCFELLLEKYGWKMPRIWSLLIRHIRFELFYQKIWLENASYLKFVHLSHVLRSLLSEKIWLKKCSYLKFVDYSIKACKHYRPKSWRIFISISLFFFISISRHTRKNWFPFIFLIELNMIVVTVFHSILNPTELQFLVHTQKNVFSYQFLISISRTYSQKFISIYFQIE